MPLTRLARGLLLALAAAPAFAFAAEPLQIPRVDGDVTVDGHLDEPVWAQAATVDLGYESQPGDNLPAAVKTTARIAYTEDALLVAFRAEDPDPAKIQAFLRDHDALGADDFVGLQLDTFDDQRRAYQFMVTALGVQADAIKVEATGEEDFSWDGLWRSAARTGAHGYDVEMRIPFATLRFADTDEARRWGARFFRKRPRDHQYLYTSSRIERGARCDLCSFDKIEGFTGVTQGRNLEITPTLTVLHAQERSAPASPWRGDGTEVEPGLDVAWSPSPNLTLNATLNPDFSQVESDEAQLDLNTSFALFFPEKRPFFLEGKDYFNTPLSVLYTRQIADPDAGLRVTGRDGRHAYGAIVARDAVTQLLVPGVLGSSFRFLEEENDVFVGRYRHDFAGSTSLGAITTFRQGDGYRNAVGGVDGRWQQGGHTVSAQWLRSDSRYPLEYGVPDAAPTGDALQAAYSYGNRRWNANVSHSFVDPGFRADLGFIAQTGIDRTLVGAGYNWYGAEGATVQRVNLSGDWDITHRHDGLLLERELEGYLDVTGARHAHLRVGGVTRVRYWELPSDTTVSGLFDESFGSLHAHVTPVSGFEIGLDARAGEQLDLLAARLGDFTEWKPWIALDIGRGLNVRATWLTQQLQRDGGTAFDASVFDGRLAWQLDARQRVRLSVQASDVERDPALYARAVTARKRDVAAQLLYSYKLNPRTAAYAGYSHGAFADDRIDTLFSSDRSVFVKLSYAWQPEF